MNYRYVPYACMNILLSESLSITLLGSLNFKA